MVTTVSYRKTKTGDWVAYGPAAAISAGAQVTVSKRGGGAESEYIERVGKAFKVDGADMVYGYIGRAPAARGSYALRPGRPGSGRCTDCGGHLSPWEIRDYIDACHDCAM